MRAQQDRDLMVIEEMLAPPPLDDARSSLEFWQRRHSKLPLYRFSARREAKTMVRRWHERVVDAELLRFERTLFGRVLKRFGVSRLWVTRNSVGRGILFDLAWVLVARRARPSGNGAAVAFVAVLAVVTALVLVAQS
jgi:hypothetical protein